MFGQSARVVDKPIEAEISGFICKATKRSAAAMRDCPLQDVFTGYITCCACWEGKAAGGKHYTYDTSMNRTQVACASVGIALVAGNSMLVRNKWPHMCLVTLKCKEAHETPYLQTLSY